MMKGKWLALFLVVFLWSPGLAGAVSESDFFLDDTGDLLVLCTAAESDPLHKEAVNFCLGFLLGAYHYHVAENKGPEGDLLVCPPDPKPSRVEVAEMFIVWLKKHPEYNRDPAVETWFRFLTEKYPCNP